MKKNYLIKGKEICGFPERSYGNVDITLLEERFNLLLEALNEKKEEPKSTLKEAIVDIIEEGRAYTISDDADKIISLFKDTLLKEINQKEKEVSHAEWTAPVGIRHRGYNDALEDIINLIKKQ